MSRQQRHRVYPSQTTTRSQYPANSGLYFNYQGFVDKDAALTLGSAVPPSGTHLLAEWTGTRWVMEYPLATFGVVTACVSSTWPSTLYLTTGGQTVTMAGSGSNVWNGNAYYTTSNPVTCDCFTYYSKAYIVFSLSCVSNVISLVYGAYLSYCPPLATFTC